MQTLVVGPGPAGTACDRTPGAGCETCTVMPRSLGADHKLSKGAQDDCGRQVAYQG